MGNHQQQDEEERTKRLSTRDRYTRKELLGRGHLGDVYRGMDTNLNQVVAIKQVNAEVGALPVFAEQFIPSVQALGRVTHPGVIRVLDVVLDASGAFVVMELLEGPDLATLLTQLRTHGQRLTFLHSVRLVQMIAQAASAIYTQSEQRPELLPAKIKFREMPDDTPTLLPPLQPVIVDLGVAQVLPPGWRFNAADRDVVFAYSSPEAIMCEPADVRSDVYMLGVLLFELLTGQLPVQAQTIGEAIDIHLNRPVPTPQLHQPTVPDALDAVIVKALAKQPAARYATCGLLHDALAALSDEQLTAIGAGGEGVPHVILPFLYEQVKRTVDRAAAGISSNKHPGVILPGGHHQPGRRSITDEQSAIAAIAGQALLQVQVADGEARVVPITTDTLTIGRTTDNDLVLDDPRVSRHHARVEFDGKGYHLVDLNSANGTYIEQQRIDRGGRLPWDGATKARIGKYTLQLLGAQATPDRAQPGGDGATLDVGAKKIYIERIGKAISRSHLQCSPDGVTATMLLGRTKLEVNPGEQAILPLILLNQQASATVLALAVEGIPATWWRLEPAQQELQPAEQREIRLVIAPPRVQESHADLYPMQIVVTNPQTPEQAAIGSAQLRINPFSEFEAAVEPEQINVGETFNIKLTHQGNRTQPFKLYLDCAESDLYFEETTLEVILSPGETETVPVTPVLSATRWLGGTKQYRVVVQINTPAASVQRFHVTVVSHSRLPFG